MRRALPSFLFCAILLLVAGCAGASSAPDEAPYSALDPTRPGVSDGGGDGGGAM